MIRKQHTHMPITSQSGMAFHLIICYSFKNNLYLIDSVSRAYYTHTTVLEEISRGNFGAGEDSHCSVTTTSF